MKILSYISGFLLLASSISCSDDFLSKNNRVVNVLTDTLFLNNRQDNVETMIPIRGISNSDYTILTQPIWMSFSSMHGKVTDGIASFSFSIEEESIPHEYQTHYSSVLLETDDGELFMFFVAFSNFGFPVLHCSDSSLNFESAVPQTFTINKTGAGILNWEITGVPEWLIISQTSGSLTSNDPVTILVSLNLDNLPHGQDLNATLQITSNSTNGNITIPVHVSAAAADEVRKIVGIVTDSEYNQDIGIMVICTKSPNTMIVFNTSTKESKTISLGKIPNCVSLSEDGHKAVIGYSVPEVSFIDIDRLEITADYTIDCLPYDIVLNDNGWCYITPLGYSRDYLRNLNLYSGELISGINYGSESENAILRKIQGEPYLVGALNPTGLMIYDVSRGIASDTISYCHVGIGNFWISADGKVLYASTREVYSLPEYNGQYNFPYPTVLGTIETDLYYISGLEECPAINSIFIFSSYSGYSYETAARIDQYNTASLNKTNSFQLSPVVLTEAGTTLKYQTSPKYIFVNREGSMLYAIKNLNENAHKDYWSIELINISNSGK
jgi:hypothetical protein